MIPKNVAKVGDLLGFITEMCTHDELRLCKGPSLTFRSHFKSPGG